MVVSCCVPRCCNNALLGVKSDFSITYHPFPPDPNLAAQWIRNINVSMPNGGTWFPQPDDKVCSQHFLRTDFKPNSTRLLKPDSVPTVFHSAVPATVLTYKKGEKRKKFDPTSPLIVKVAKPDDDCQLLEPNEQSSSSNNSIDNSFSTAASSSLTTESPLSVNGSQTNFQTSNGQVASESPKSKITSVKRGSQNSSSLLNLRVTNVKSVSTGTHAGKPASSSQMSTPFGKNTNSVAYSAVTTASTTETTTASTSTANISKQRQHTTSKSKPNQKQKPPMDLIEIGPSTFLKINPDVIKVTKKVTPIGNTVLQFVMNPNLAGIDTKNIIQAATASSPSFSESSSSFTDSSSCQRSSDQEVSVTSSGNTNIERCGGIEHPLSSKEIANEETMVPDTTSQNDDFHESIDTPVVLTTDMTVKNSVSIAERQDRYFKALKQKNRIIQSLRTKISKLLKKGEELENKCIVQERQLNFPSLKKLKAIKKNAENGEPHANFILEQIRGYFRNVPLRWSTSTMNQCSVWCRKAPYAYEYFKKADLFRLPALATVKRYMKNHPEITMQIKNRTLGAHIVDSDSSSDFDFDESEGEGVHGDGDNNDDEDIPEELESSQTASETVQNEKEHGENSVTAITVVPDINLESRSSSHIDNQLLKCNKNCPSTASDTRDDYCHDTSDFNQCIDITDSASNEEMAVTSQDGNETVVPTTSNSVDNARETVSSENSRTIANMCPPTVSTDASKTVEKATENMASGNRVNSVCLSSTSLDSAVSTVNLNGQEIILQPGNVIQLNTGFSDSDFENQYFVIPTSEEQTTSDHQYSVGQPVSFVIQGSEDQSQVIYIADNGNAADTVAVSLTN